MTGTKTRTIEKPDVSEEALSMFKHMFYDRIFYIESQKRSVTTYPQQMKIQRLQGNMKRFILSRAYSFFRIVVLPENGADIENAKYTLEIKNFDYFVEGLNPHRYCLVISKTWDDFTAFEETVDKNLIPIRL